ncbi:BRCA1-associated ATM activator 1 [Sciurus carolinensis]|uniref:BRCA1-associated ATM activator 1 n=1 Tax=Sciurus carolinensis TaxID=30640 RepID=A0AA41MZ44_SCICA|nr:BRCA1-associated ATM activator 1 [Sciurus carolinensis]
MRTLCQPWLLEFAFCALFDGDHPVAQKAFNLLLFLRDKTALYDGMQETGDNPWLDFMEAALQRWQAGEQDPESEDWLTVLRFIDMEALQGRLVESSDHVEKNPQSLLQDVLATVDILEENEADCY